MKLIIILSLAVMLVGCGQRDIETAYSDGYRVGYSHAENNRPAQLGCGSDLKFRGVGKECLYDDEILPLMLHMYKKRDC